jgi:hypothetical protein
MSVDKREEEKKIVEESNQKDKVFASQFGFERGLLSEFNASVLQPSNTSGGVAPPLPLSTAPTVVAALLGPTAMHIDDVADRVWLTATVGWQAITNGTGQTRVDVLFKIFRNAPITGPLVFSTRDSGEVAFDTFKNTSFVHVDLTPLAVPGHQRVTYFLTAELPLVGSGANVIGPITFTGAEVERNRIFNP